MQKRIEIIVRNPGFEGTDSALGAHTLDFEDRAAFDRAVGMLHSALAPNAALGLAIVIANEKGQERGFSPEHYVTHRIDDVSEWELAEWQLPQGGSMAPPREQET
jgi:hypothetical protein